MRVLYARTSASSDKMKKLFSKIFLWADNHEDEKVLMQQHGKLSAMVTHEFRLFISTKAQQFDESKWSG